MRTNSLALLKAVVANGSHVTIVSHAVMYRELQRKQVRILELEMPVVQREAGLIYLRDRPRTTAVERLMQIVREAGREDQRVPGEAAVS